MKRLVVLLCILFLWTQNTFARPGASATFFSKRGELFQFVLDGRLVNRGGTNVIQIQDIPAGYHDAEFRIPGRRGVLVHRTRLFLEPGWQTDFMLQVAGPRQLFVRKVAEKPLVPIYRGPRRYPHDGGYDRDDRHRPDDRYRQNDDNDYRYPNNDRYENQDNGYETPRGNSESEQCRDMMEKQQVDRLLQSMTNKTENAKQSIARQALSQNSILAEDVKSILQQFDLESTRLDFAKFAYNATCDRRNFYMVNEAFDYENSIRELERYINQK